ncbi:hypothetical protein LNV08_11775 [Paucibacter sp. TC2R-5]|uniref:hypothetical protein n=1 Tax=Paucibacter sp. TC2R-5 TaxID=2893555 RepID=UPI0021E49505|nr:hypothetical protein [Paucibacter sp. TC2R-5]MCV2359648.1 hypothetical protein [Paucibacter sp. TC2R-5]
MSNASLAARLAGAGAVALLLFAAGAYCGGLRAKAQLAGLQAEHAQQRAQAVQTALAAEQIARAAADSSQARLAALLQTNATLTQEKTLALQQATFDRPCLGGRALRVLNGAPGLRVAELPSGAARPADPGGTAASHPGAAREPGELAESTKLGEPDEWVSSDRAVAHWILNAGAQYEACRARLDALIDYETQAHPPTP